MPKRVYWSSNLEDIHQRLRDCKPPERRSRGLLEHNRLAVLFIPPLLGGKSDVITRLMTFASIIALAVALLSHSSPDSRMVISIVVSVGVLLLSIRAFSLARFVWGLVFLALLGVYTPFRSAEFSPRVYLIFDLVTLALFAVSPLILKRAKIPAISTAGSRVSS